MTRASTLLELQQLEDRLTMLAGEAAAVEARLASDPTLERLREEVVARASDEQDAQQIVAAGDKRASELRNRARTLERRLYDGSVRNPQELLTMQHELDGLRATMAGVEEELLMAMERAEDFNRAVREASEAVAAREQQRAQSAGPDSQKLARLRADAAAAEEEKREVTGRIREDDLRLFRRLSGRLRPAVVRLMGEACGGCRLPLGAREVREVRLGRDLVQCPSCDRILVS